MPIRQLRTIVPFFALVSACSRGAEPVDTSSTTAVTDMKDMPGMVMNAPQQQGHATSDSTGNSIGFTVAQVRNGKVRWEPVTVVSTTGTATVPGQVVPNEDRTARLGSPVSGRVVAVHVRPGEHVERGQVLVTLASPEAGMAQADLSKATAAQTAARAQSAYAKSARERAERLLLLKAIPQQEYERAVADDAQAQAMLAQANAEVGRANSTASQLGGTALTGELAVRASLRGVVLQRMAVPGTVVAIGAPLVVVTDPSSLWLTVNAPESLVSAFRRGGELHFSVPSYPGEQFTARIDAVGAGLDPDTRTLPVRAIITGRAVGERLKPEMLASVTVVGGPAVAAVLLPEDAVQIMDGKPTVFLAAADASGGARFTARVVETGPRSNRRVAVTRGLVAGDIVVTVGAFRVKAQFKNGSMPDMVM